MFEIKLRNREVARSFMERFQSGDLKGIVGDIRSVRSRKCEPIDYVGIHIINDYQHRCSNGDLEYIQEFESVEVGCVDTTGEKVQFDPITEQMFVVHRNDDVVTLHPAVFIKDADIDERKSRDIRRTSYLRVVTNDIARITNTDRSNIWAWVNEFDLRLIDLIDIRRILSECEISHSKFVSFTNYPTIESLHRNFPDIQWIINVRRMLRLVEVIWTIYKYNGDPYMKGIYTCR